MRLLGLTLLTIFVIACSGTAPTSPSIMGAVPSLDGTDVKSAPQRISLFFWSDEDRPGGSVHIVNMPVHIVAAPSGDVFNLSTDRQGRVRFELSATDASVAVTWSNFEGYCASESTGVVVQTNPLKSGNGFILVHRECFAAAN